MKEIYNKKFKVYMLEPETVMEAVEELEKFLIADWGAPDWNENFLKQHFAICKKQIKKIIKFHRMNDKKCCSCGVGLNEDKKTN